MVGQIHVLGAQEHNLKKIDVSIPKGKIVAFTGVSGSGKSSLVFDTLYAESFRRFSDASQIPLHLMSRSELAISRRARFAAIHGLPPALGLSQRQGVAGRLSTVGTISGTADLLRVYFAAFGEIFCRNCEVPLAALSFPEILVRIKEHYLGKKLSIFSPIAKKRKGSFADELERFKRFGFSRVRLNGQLVRLDGNSDDLRLDARKLNTVELLIDSFQLREERLPRLERAVLQAADLASVVLVEDEGCAREAFNLSSACPSCGESAPELDPRHFSHSSLGQCTQCAGTGVVEREGVGSEEACPACQGSRLSAELPRVKIAKHEFRSLISSSISACLKFAQNIHRSLQREKDLARFKVIDELVRLFQVQERLGLGHLQLTRSGSSLSPGDLQRLRLSSLFANRLAGAMYVLDEPCQGLTQHEAKELARFLREFVDGVGGNSVLVVEHHPEFLKRADQVFVMGPGAGRWGGEIVRCVSADQYDPEFEFEQHEQMKTRGSAGRFLEKESDAHGDAHPSGVLSLQFGNFRNLTGRKIEFHVGEVHLLRGPSGAGKSSVIEHGLVPLLELLQKESVARRKLQTSYVKGSVRGELRVDGIQLVRPGSLQRSSRRFIAAALGILPLLRERFAALSASQVLGLQPSDFSWSSKQGQCPECSGRGYIEHEQRYAPPLRLQCESCEGVRLKSQSLLPRLRGKNLAEVLEMSLDEAHDFFANDRQILLRIADCLDFGLGYVSLNQVMESLSGGEMQRLILTMELRRQKVSGHWYILHHPGTGLHLPDIRVLGRLLRNLVQRGGTLVLIENREEFVEFADRVTCL